jgi:hypothetical protein
MIYEQLVINSMNNKNFDFFRDANEIAIKGKVFFKTRYDDFRDQSEDKIGEEYNSGFHKNPTWLTVFKCADESIKTTKDYPHCFLEGIKMLREHKDRTKVYTFEFGS